MKRDFISYYSRYTPDAIVKKSCDNKKSITNLRSSEKKKNERRTLRIYDIRNDKITKPFKNIFVA